MLPGNVSVSFRRVGFRVPKIKVGTSDKGEKQNPGPRVVPFAPVVKFLWVPVTPGTLALPAPHCWVPVYLPLLSPLSSHTSAKAQPACCFLHLPCKWRPLCHCLGCVFCLEGLSSSSPTPIAAKPPIQVLLSPSSTALLPIHSVPRYDMPFQALGIQESAVRNIPQPLSSSAIWEHIANSGSLQKQCQISVPSPSA